MKEDKSLPCLIPLLPFSITLNNLFAGYGRHSVLEDVSFTLSPKDFFAITGPNGGGKSTLVKLMCGLHHHTSGTMNISGLERYDIAYLPQHNTLDNYFPITVKDVVAMGLYHKMGPWKRYTKEDWDKVFECIETVGLLEFAHRQISTLSGGQFQRMLFARLMIQDAKVLFLDEPFSAIDDITSEKLIELLKSWNRSGKTIAVILHDVHMLSAHFENVIYVKKTLRYMKSADAFPLRPATGDRI